METQFTKDQILKCKLDIKELAQYQTILKNQRKTVHIIGDRIMPADEASAIHSFRRHKLRHMYIAYAQIRGKDYSNVEKNAKHEYDKKLVTNILKVYESYEDKTSAIRISA